MRRVVLGVALVVLGACAQRSAADVISSAPAAARTARSAAISIVSTVNITAQGQQITTKSTGDGFADLTNHASTMHLVVSGIQTALQPCDMVASGNIAYTSIAPKMRPPDNKSWSKIDIGKLTGLDVNSLNSDPTAELDYLKSVSGNVVTVGHENVRGTPTTHYRFTVTTDQLLAKLQGIVRDRVKSQLAELGISSVPIDAWIDAQNLPRRVTTEMKGSVRGNVSLDISTTVEMFDYGKAVNVTIPPATSVRTNVASAKAFEDCFGITVPGQ